MHFATSKVAYWIHRVVHSLGSRSWCSLRGWSGWGRRWCSRCSTSSLSLGRFLRAGSGWCHNCTTVSLVIHQADGVHAKYTQLTSRRHVLCHTSSRLVLFICRDRIELSWGRLVSSEGGSPSSDVALLVCRVLDIGLSHSGQVHEVLPQAAGNHTLAQVCCECPFVVQLLHNVRSARFEIVPP